MHCDSFSLDDKYNSEENRMLVARSRKCFTKISVSEEGSIIYVTETYDGEKEYGLEKISDMFVTEMRGWLHC